MRFWAITFLLLLFGFAAYGQPLDDKTSKAFGNNKKIEASVLTGFNQGKYSFVDVGMEFNQAGATGVHSFSFSYSVSSEIKLGQGKTLIGPKIGVWVAGGPAFGVNVIYYTDFERSSMALRPEIGFGVTKFKLVYGYNWLLTNSLTGVNKSQISITYCFAFGRRN